MDTFETVTFSADGKLLAAGGDDRQIMLRAVGRLGQPIPLAPVRIISR